MTHRRGDGDTPLPNQPPTTMVKLGRLTLSGPPAAAAILVFLLSIAGLIVYLRPSMSNWPLWVSGALWLLFMGYWSAAARNASPAKSSESRESRRRHGLLLNFSLLLLFVPVPGLRQRYLPAGFPVVAAGLALQVASGLLAVWARRHLGRHWSGAITIKVDHELVRSGPYRILRHPIYSAMLGMYAGTALVSGQWHALLAVAIVALAYWRKIRLEEQALREAFRTDYDAYRRRTWALVPGLF